MNHYWKMLVLIASVNFISLHKFVFKVIVCSRLQIECCLFFNLQHFWFIERLRYRWTGLQQHQKRGKIKKTNVSNVKSTHLTLCIKRYVEHKTIRLHDLSTITHWSKRVFSHIHQSMTITTIYVIIQQYTKCTLLFVCLSAPVFIYIFSNLIVWQ